MASTSPQHVGLLTVATLAIHTLLLVAVDAITVLHRPTNPAPAPRFDSFEIALPPPPEALAQQPTPAATPAPQAAPPPTPTRIARATATRVRGIAPSRMTQVPATSPGPNETQAPDLTGGGAPTVAVANLGPAATGVAVATGPRAERNGAGGSGGGTGTGTGTGSGAGDAPVSVAAIAVRAMPKGDYAHFNDYTEEAKRAGVAGAVKVRLVVNAQGQVTQRKLLQGLGYGLDELALARAATLQFEPARDTAGRAVSSVVVWTFQFSVR